MAGKRQLSTRNQRMDLYRGIAIYAVITIHILFPGRFGIAAVTLARFAVPFFFLTAGYFCLSATPHVLRRKIAHTFKLLLLSCLPFLVWDLTLNMRNGQALLARIQEIFTLHNLTQFIFLHAIPIYSTFHLWFMGALLVVYMLWWAITTLCHTLGRPLPYDALAIVSILLLIIHLILGEGFALMGKHTEIPLIRNAFLFGFPFFALGCWAAFRRHAIRRSDIPWHLLIPAGAVLSLAEAKLAGKQEIFLGTLILLAGIMGRCIRYRRVSEKKLSQALQFCGQKLTFPIYVLHVAVIVICQNSSSLSTLQKFPWIMPIFVAAVSTLLSVALLWFKATFFRRKGRI